VDEVGFAAKLDHDVNDQHHDGSVES